MTDLTKDVREILRGTVPEEWYDDLKEKYLELEGKLADAEKLTVALIRSVTNALVGNPYQDDLIHRLTKIQQALNGAGSEE